MPKNTFTLVAVLAVVAALVVGVNIGRSVNPTSIQQPQSTPLTPTPLPQPTQILKQFTGCGITFSYPDTLTELSSETGGAMLINTSNPKDSIAVVCQKDIPRPALTQDNIEELKIGTLSATLYHDSSAKDGSSIDKLLIRHPKTGLDVYVAGLGANFTSLIETISLE